jgi:hypothetical protein
MKNSDWDLDFRHGVDGENMVANLLSIETVEVKNDRRWSETGNVYIETDCYYVNSQAWEPSGINVSKATHWAFVLDEVVVILPLERLKKIVERFGRPITCNIPPNYSRGFLISVVELMAVIDTGR